MSLIKVAVAAVVASYTLFTPVALTVSERGVIVPLPPVKMPVPSV